ncbi:MAG TPA: porin, partial [Gammaproteobacteria bacterium]
MKLKSATLYSAASVLLVASGAALAEVDVYGKANVTLQNSDEAGISEIELKSNASRFGLKGNEVLSDGLKVIYQFEWEVDPTDRSDTSDDPDSSNHIKARNQFVGLTGDFGTLKVGRHDTALKLAQGDFDLFNDLEGDIKNILNGENRESNFIGYTTPAFADAFSVTVNLIPGEDAAAGNDGIADGTSISLNYETDTVYAALAQDSDIDGAGIDTLRATGGYKFGAAQVNLIYQQTDAGATDGDG